MDDAAAAVAGALVFTWLGMVLAISFLEAPLKFRAPGVTIRIGLGIGRLVFRALNIAELILAGAVSVAVAAGDPSTTIVVVLGALILLLLVQLSVIRPVLNKRSDRVLAAPDTADVPRSRAHLSYVGAEMLKLVLLVALGVLVLAS